MLTYVLVALLAIGIALGAYALFAPQRSPRAAAAPQPLVESTAALAPEPPAAAGPLAGLSEAERCEMIFAMAALDDDESRGHVTNALDDRSEPVALAAAHALATGGRLDVVRAYAAANPGPRAERLLYTVSLLG